MKKLPDLHKLPHRPRLAEPDADLFWKGPSPVVNHDGHTLGIIFDGHINVLWRAASPVTVAEWIAVVDACKVPGQDHDALIAAVLAVLPERIPGVPVPTDA